jgi:putative tricarboxylic transport membrane protein
VLMSLDFSVAPIMLGFVLGPMVEENFRRALLLSRGSMLVFVQRPISATFVGMSVLLLLGVTWSAWRGKKRGKPQESVAEEILQSAHVPQQQISEVTP